MAVNAPDSLIEQQLADAQARIAELEKAMTEAHELQNLFRIVLDAIPVRVFWKDVNLNYLGANTKFAEDAGFKTPDQLIGKSDYEMGWKEQAELYRSDDSAVIKSGGEKINYEEPQTTPEGERMWLETSKIPLRDSSGTTIGILGTYADITPRKRDQEALIESEAKSRALIQALPDVAFVVKRDGTFLEYHAPETTDVHVATEEVVGKKINEVMPPTIAADLLKKVSDALSTGSVQSYEYTMPLADGLSYFEARFSPASGDTAVVVVRNVTERRQAEEALRVSETRYRALVSNVPGMTFTLFDRNLRHLVVEGDAGRPMGVHKDLLEGKIISDVLPEVVARLPVHDESERELFRKTYQGVIDMMRKAVTGEQVYFESSPHATGQSFATTFAPVRDESGEVIGGLSILQDITERRKSEEQVRRLASIVENTSDFVGSALPNGQTVYINPAGQKILGLASGEDITGRTITEFVPARLQQEVFNVQIPMAIEHGTWTGEAAFQDIHGREIPMLQTVIVQKSPDGSPATVSVLARDITEQKRAAAERERLIEELQVANRIARESSRAKSEFLATISHELRTPLNAIIGFSDMLLIGMSGPLNDKQQHKMARLKENGSRLLSLINDLLDLTRIEAGRVEIAQKVFDPRGMVERLMAQMESIASETKLELRTVVADDLPQILIGDEKRIEQVVLNLLSNAFKFTEKGSVALEVKPDLDAQTWSLAVSDTGIGIPPHAQNLIFEAFRQVDGSYSRSYRGSGLGLAITRDLVRMMDGKIGVKSTVGVGTTFTVVLPMNVPVTDEFAVQQAAN